MATYEGPLGRLPAPDDRHLRKFSLTGSTMPTTPTAVVLGSYWYEAFDRLWQDKGGNYWLAEPGSGPADWGAVRGGHAYCLKPLGLVDLIDWWKFYDQLREGACVGFGLCRAQTLHNRVRYSGSHLYREALKIDEWPGEADEGTSVRAGCEIARTQGMWLMRNNRVSGPKLAHGIDVYRWCRSVEDIAYCLDPATMGQRVMNMGYVTMLNSWGTAFPHYVRIPLPVVQTIIFAQGGDATLLTDR
jgi:hypothetical protein